MFSKANLLSTLVAAVWSFLGGWLLWGILGEPLLNDYIVTDGLMRETPVFLYLILGCIVQAFAISTIYSRWGNGIYGASSGLKLGLWIGLLTGLGEGLIDFATANLIDLTGTLINTVIYLVFYGILGLLVGFVYQKNEGVAQDLNK